MDSFSGPQACKLAGITYRQLDYWARIGLVVPSVKETKGSGTHRGYSYSDVVQLTLTKGLSDAGLSLEGTRRWRRDARSLEGITVNPQWVDDQVKALNQAIADLAS